ncbi:MAG: NapC/NirT family cytochrome c [Tistlia sp.]|uniref:NapC/NirT family cytochrome c n=1 Tax=Tistlia sp. TaxID=3057121 RepID=UPI0034A0D39D
MRTLKRYLSAFWRIASRPSAYLPLGVLTLGGFVFGVVFWGGFNTVLEATNTEAFCVTCHEMYENPYQELQQTVHFTNRTGVRATCPDCHVPHEWTDKIARKMQASKEVWGHIFGTISTQAKYQDHRLVMAKREWNRLKANDSHECRNCHRAEAMDLVKQNSRAERIHQQFLFTGERTCIDCHKGIAHRLPDMSDVEPGWTVEPGLQGDSSL